MASGGLTPTSSSSYYTTGYQTPADHPDTRSSSPGSGSFHTANPVSARSTPAHMLTDEEDSDWPDHQPGDISTMPMMEDEAGTPLVVGHPVFHSPIPSDEEEAEVTLRNNPTPPMPPSSSALREKIERNSSGATASGHREGRGGGGGGGGDRNWMDQPKLIAADTEAVPPCPEKRPLDENNEVGRRPRGNRTEGERTPLLQPSSDPHNNSNQEQEQDCNCCTLL